MRKVKTSCFLLLIVLRAAVARSSGDCQEDRIQIAVIAPVQPVEHCLQMKLSTTRFIVLYIYTIIII